MTLFRQKFPGCALLKNGYIDSKISRLCVGRNTVLIIKKSSAHDWLAFGEPKMRIQQWNKIALGPEFGEFHRVLNLTEIFEFWISFSDVLPLDNYLLYIVTKFLVVLIGFVDNNIVGPKLNKITFFVFLYSIQKMKNKTRKTFLVRDSSNGSVAFPEIFQNLISLWKYMVKSLSSYSNASFSFYKNNQKLVSLSYF